MKHLEPLPQAKINKKNSTSKSNKRLGLRSLLALAALIVIMGFTATSAFHRTQSDNLSDTTKKQIADEFLLIKSIQLQTIPTSEIKSALDSMGLDPKQRTALENTVNNSNKPHLNLVQTNNTKMVWLELWDFATQDGDSVSVSSSGYQTLIPLLKTPTRIAVPVDDNQSIQITGVRDGGGGITLGIKSGTNNVSLPVLPPGQTINLPVIL